MSELVSEQVKHMSEQVAGLMTEQVSENMSPNFAEHIKTTVGSYVATGFRISEHMPALVREHMSEVHAKRYVRTHISPEQDRCQRIFQNILQPLW